MTGRSSPRITFAPNQARAAEAEIMRSKLTPRGKERREQLIACAAQLFAEKGYHPTSVADIVAALGVGKGVFYWYFQSKEELLTELLKSSNHELRKRQQQALAARGAQDHFHQFLETEHFRTGEVRARFGRVG